MTQVFKFSMTHYCAEYSKMFSEVCIFSAFINGEDSRQKYFFLLDWAVNHIFAIQVDYNFHRYCTFIIKITILDAFYGC